MRRLVAVLAALVGGVVAAPAHAGSVDNPVTGPPPTVAAKAYAVANAATGEVLAAENAGARLSIASITKLMTVLVALKHLQPDELVTVDPAATGAGGSTLRLRPGETISVRDLLEGALIQSANDAADALADAAADGDRDRFVGWMNRRARQLGLSGTHFTRPDGLDARGHFSTARDVLRLAQVAMHVPLVRQIVRERTETISGGRVVHTWNDLLGVFPGLIGVKTGHTSAAGWCEVAAAQRSGYTIYAVILGSPTRGGRNDDLTALLRWGVAQYRAAPVVAAGHRYAAAELGWGKRPLALVASERLVRAYRVARPLAERVVAPPVVRLPVTRGQALGRVEIWDGKRLLGTRPLVASRSVARLGLSGRVAFYARRTVHHVLGFFS